MPRRSNAKLPRSSLPSSRQRLIEFGARHPIEYDEKLDEFFSYMHTALGMAINPDIDGKTPNKRFFRIYDDPDRAGISIIERRLSRQQAQRGNVSWTNSDAGRIRQEIQNEIERCDLGGRTLNLTFTDVVRVGDADDKRKARKIALLPDPESAEAEFLLAEHEIAIEGIKGPLASLRYPYDEFLPHWTVSRIHQEAGHDAMSKGIQAVRHLLPLTVQLQPVEFFVGERL